MQPYIKKFRDTGIKDVAMVGGKNASLGEMISRLSASGIKVPDGFATTADAFWLFLDHNKLRQPLIDLISRIDKKDYANLSDIGAAARQLILDAEIPAGLSDQIIKGYRELSGYEDAEVAVRSSATAEDLPNASFAGQHESYLNIKGGQALLKAVR
ncbi:MAG TPA: PEP/pyruvate-binding domain-containing protein, partial [Chitinophagaceae bacterium]